MRSSILLVLALAACSAPSTRTAPVEAGPGSERAELLDRLDAAAERAEAGWSEPVQVDGGVPSHWEPHWSNGHFMALVGKRDLDDAGLAGLDDPTDLGLVWDANPGSRFFQIEAGLYYAGASTTRFVPPNNSIGLSTETIEGNLGLAKWFQLGDSPLQLFAAVGASFLWSEGELSVGNGIKDDDTSLGYYGRVGLVTYLGRSGQFVGLDYRYLGGTDLTIGNSNVDMDGSAIHLVFGFAF